MLNPALRMLQWAGIAKVYCLSVSPAVRCPSVFLVLHLNMNATFPLGRPATSDVVCEDMCEGTMYAIRL